MFNKIISESIRAVCEAFSMQTKVLYNSHTESATALRWCAVGVLSEYFSDLQLSEVLPIGRKCINKIRNAYVRRFRRWSERQLLDEVRKIIVAVIGEKKKSYPHGRDPINMKNRFISIHKYSKTARLSQAKRKLKFNYYVN